MLGEVWAGFQALQQLPTCWLEGRQSGGHTAVFRKRALLTDVCFLSWALSSRDQRNPAMSHFSGKILVCWSIFFFLLEALTFLVQRQNLQLRFLRKKIWKLWWPTFLLMNRVCSCLYQVPSLTFCLLPFPPCIFFNPLMFLMQSGMF